MEIGGSFSLALDNYLGIVEPNKLKKYELISTGRACLKYIALRIPCGKILLPSYICSSMLDAWDNHEIIFYPMQNRLEIDVQFINRMIRTGTITGILIIHYFGVVDPNINIITTICRNKGIPIIEDTTHSYLNITQKYGDYEFCSLRKTLPIPDGAYMNLKITRRATVDINYYKFLFIRIVGMILKRIPLLKFIWYRLLIRAEKMVDVYSFDVKPTNFFILHLDLDEISHARKLNYKYLYTKLSHLSLYPNTKDLMFGFPILLKNRDFIRQKLIDAEIYCPVHWHLPSFITDKHSHNISKHILTIPIDQRYTPNNLKRVVDIINTYINE